MKTLNPNDMYYGHVLRANGQVLTENQTLTATSTKGNGQIVMADRTQGSLSIIIQAADDCSFTANATLNVLAYEGPEAKEAGMTAHPVRYAATFAKATTFKEGQVIGVLPLPEDFGPYAQSYASSSASDIIVDLVLAYVPR